MSTWSDSPKKYGCMLSVKNPDDIENSFKEFLLEFIHEYFRNRERSDSCAFKNESFIKDIILSRYGIGKDPETLENIGYRYGCTREFVRQKQAQILGAIKKCIVQDLYEDRFCKIRLEHSFKSKIGKIQEDAANLMLFKKEDLLSKNEDINEWIFDLLVKDIFDLKVVQPDYNKEKYYYYGDTYSISNLKEVMRHIKKYFKNEIKPIKLVELKDLLIKKFGPINVAEDLDILKAICLAYNLQEGALDGFITFSIPDKDITNIPDFIYRILYNKTEKMHYKDILAEVERITGRCLRNKGCLPIYSDSRSVPIGKTGYWVLKEWGYSTLTYKEVLEIVMSKKSKPVYITEVYNEVKRMKPDAKLDTVTSILNMYDCFVNIDRSRYCTKELSDKLGLKNRRTLLRNSVKMHDFTKSTIDFLADKEVALSSLVNYLSDKHNMRKVSVRSKLDKCKITSRNIKNGKVYVRLKKGARPVYQNEVKKNLIAAYIKNFLKRNGSVKLLDLVSKVCSSFNCSKPYAYRIISEEIKDIEKHEDPNDRKVIILNYAGN